MLKSGAELIEEALKLCEMGDVPGAETAIAYYEQRRATGGFKPMVEVDGDRLKCLLIDLLNTKEELVRLQEQSNVKKLKTR